MNRPVQPPPNVLVELQQRLGHDVVRPGDAASLARHMSDHAPLLARAVTPLGAAYPRTTAEVAEILRFCNERAIPVTPQGGLTGMAGGALPEDGGLILSMERMREIEEVDLASATMTVQAGVPLQRIQERADAVDLLFPLDLGARGSCLIGGNIATNAGGNRVLRYGMMRELLLGLEVVLADGTVVSSLNKMLKNNAGYDMKQLFVGSEGTLGVVTRAVLRLFPKPRSTCVALCAAPDYESVLKLLQLARGVLGGTLSAYEVMWREFYELAASGRPRALPLSTGQPFYVLIEALGTDEESDRRRFETLVEQAFASEVISDATVAQSERDNADFWAIRDASGELHRLFGPAVNFDISIPTGDIEAFAIDCRARLRERLGGGETLVFGHIADSNIHLSCRGPTDDLPAAVIEEVVYGAVRDWRGSVSAEHGIGLGKRAYLGHSRSEAEIALMWRMKRALDPVGILNPGKVLPAP